MELALGQPVTANASLRATRVAAPYRLPSLPPDRIGIFPRRTWPAAAATPALECPKSAIHQAWNNRPLWQYHSARSLVHGSAASKWPVIPRVSAGLDLPARRRRLKALMLLAAYREVFNPLNSRFKRRRKSLYFSPPSLDTSISSLMRANS